MNQIERCHYLSGRLTIPLGAALTLVSDNEHVFPELCFMDDFCGPNFRRLTRRLLAGELTAETPMPVREVSWGGEGSGSSFDFLVEKVLPLTRGEADILVAYDGGDLHGFRVTDGKVTKMKVKVTLE